MRDVVIQGRPGGGDDAVAATQTAVINFLNAVRFAADD
jgi:hypothetical protein